MESLPERKFPAPEDEIALLRQEVKRLQSERDGMPKEDAAHEAVETYRVMPTQTALPEDRKMPDRLISMTAMGLKEETHDDQIEALLALLPEKGVKNVMLVAEKTGNPHLIDDLHRALVRYIASDLPLANFSEKDPLWKPLHMSLYEIRLPESGEENKEKSLQELVSGMEQFYSGMLANVANNTGTNFTFEIANENGSNDFVFYIGIARDQSRLLEKQILGIFPNATVSECQDDYNIFNESGVSVASYAQLERHWLYPLSSYQDFDVDPLGVILNSFSKINEHGEGAAVQFVVGPRRDDYLKKGEGALEDIRKGESLDSALAKTEAGIASKAVKEIFGAFKNKEAEEKEKVKKAERAGALDQSLLEEFGKKLKSSMVSVSLRVVTSAASEGEAKAILGDIKSGFGQFENGRGNRIAWKDQTGAGATELLKNFSLRMWNERERMIWSIEEMTTVMHLPAFTASKDSPQLRQNQTTSAPAPSGLPSEGTLLGVNDFRGTETKVRISLEDRMRHFYIIGQTGTGKTTLMKNMLIQDIKEGHGVCMIDPHGTDIADVLGAVPPEREDDVIYFDPARTDMVLGLNMLEFDESHPEQKTFVVNELFSIFQKLYGAVPESMGPMFEQYFRNATLLVLEDPASGSTLLDISRVFADESYRKMKLSKTKNPVVAQFWNDIATKAGGEASLENIVPYITSKFDVFTANDFIRPIIGQQTSSFNFRKLMDEKKILLVNLSKGRLGEINANLIGMIIVGKILMAALSRADDITKSYSPFFLHMDEFQNISTDSISAILSEARKYKLGLTVAHQFIAQLDEGIRDAVFGNVGSMASFRVGPDDAEFLESQFAPVFTARDLMNVENRQAFLRILSNGSPVKPFNIKTLPPEAVDPERVKDIVEQSYQRHARPRRQVEMEISARYL